MMRKNVKVGAVIAAAFCALALTGCAETPGDRAIAPSGADTPMTATSPSPTTSPIPSQAPIPSLSPIPVATAGAAECNGKALPLHRVKMAIGDSMQIDGATPPADPPIQFTYDPRTSEIRWSMNNDPSVRFCRMEVELDNPNGSVPVENAFRDHGGVYEPREQDKNRLVLAIKATYVVVGGQDG